MSNSFVTAKLIAEQALPLLKDQISFLPLVHRGYDGTFKKAGDTIQVVKPQRMSTVDGSTSIASSYVDIDEDAVEVTLNTQRAVPVVVTSKEKTLNIKDFARQVIKPATVALAEYVNSALAGLYIDIPYYVGTSGTTPDGLDDLANLRKKLNENRAPRDMRSFVMDYDAEAKLIQLDSLVEVDKSGTNSALRDAALGRVYGTLLAADADIKTHTAGTFCAIATPLTDGATAKGATSIVMDGGSGTETILKGDIFTIDGIQYVATANATAASGEVTVPVYPAVPAAIDDGTSVAFPDKTAKAHVANLAFQKNAFCFATAPLEAPEGAKSYTVQADGLSLRVVEDYDIDTDQNKFRMDILFGVKTLYRELATRVLG